MEGKAVIRGGNRCEVRRMLTVHTPCSMNLVTASGGEGASLTLCVSKLSSSWSFCESAMSAVKWKRRNWANEQCITGRMKEIIHKLLTATTSKTSSGNRESSDTDGPCHRRCESWGRASDGGHAHASDKSSGTSTCDITESGDSRHFRLSRTIETTWKEWEVGNFFFRERYAYLVPCFMLNIHFWKCP